MASNGHELSTTRETETLDPLFSDVRAMYLGVHVGESGTNLDASVVESEGHLSCGWVNVNSPGLLVGVGVGHGGGTIS
jgi:hypothetical protein